jgi:gliding motility-associated-like protein
LSSISTIIFRFLFLIFTFLLGTNAFAQMEFVQNKGQWDKRVQFKGDFSTGAFFLENKGFTVLMYNPEDLLKRNKFLHGDYSKKSAIKATDVLHAHAYNVTFLGANDKGTLIPDKALPTYNNYFIGTDKTKWAADCKLFYAVTIKDIYPKIDVRYYSTMGQLKYDFIVHPGGNPAVINLRYDGVTGLEIKNKELNIKTSVGNAKELEPYSYQTNKNGKQDVMTKYVLKDNVVSFDVDKYDAQSTLIIDPQLIFSSFTRSTSDNWGFTATPGADGSFFSGGIVFGTGFPVSLGALQTQYGGGIPDNWTTGFDIGIFKFSPNGTQRLYATYLGGNANEQPHSLVADANGNLIIAGRTNSANYPLQTSIPATGTGFDIILTKLNATGSAIIGSARIGGTANDGVNIAPKDFNSGDTSLRRNYGEDAKSEVILDANNNVILASCSQSADFPTFAAFQPTFAGKQDGVILKLTPNLNSLIFSTFFGGLEDDACYVTAINPITNNLYVGGATKSNNLPGSTAGTINTSFLGRIDGFVTQINQNGSAILKTTYVGTSDASSVEAVYGLKFDKYGYPYIMGTTTGNWVAINAFYNVPNSKQFIAKLQPDLSAYIYSTNFGTSTNDPTPNISPIAFLVDRCENVYVSGWGGLVNSGYSNSGTLGLPEVGQLPGQFTPDGSDFYFFVLKKDAQAQLFGSHFGQNGAAGEHVDGGTSRFDENGIIYQAMCANCLGFGAATFPTFPPASSPNAPWSSINPSNNCNLAAVKIDMDFSGVATTIQSSIAGVLNDTLGCTPVTVFFKDTLQKGVKYFWNFNSIAFPNAVDAITNHPDTSHLFLATGIYRVRLISEDSSTCNIRDTSYINIEIADRVVTPKFTFQKIGLCNSTTYEFTNISFPSDATVFNSKSFVWDYDDGSPKDTANKTPVRIHTFPGPGTYFVKLTAIDERFCNTPKTDTQKVIIITNVKAIPIQLLGGCSPYTPTFQNNSLNGVTYLWEFVNTATGNIIGTSTDFTPTFTFANEGTYKYRLIARNAATCNLADTSAYFSFPVLKSPIAKFDWTPKPIEAEELVRFINLSSFATSYLWNFGDTVTSTLFEPTHIYAKKGIYNVVLTAFNTPACAQTIVQPVIVVASQLLDVPNAFTPGKFGTNSVVYVRGYGIGKMDWRIYNRWGEVVFKSVNKKEGWDGFYKGKLQPMDVYTYTLDVEFVDGQKARKTGDISLLR